MVLCSLSALLFQGCASLNSNPEAWRALAQGYNDSTNAHYERLNQYRQGPALRAYCDPRVQLCPQ